METERCRILDYDLTGKKIVISLPHSGWNCEPPADNMLDRVWSLKLNLDLSHETSFSLWHVSTADTSKNLKYDSCLGIVLLKATTWSQRIGNRVVSFYYMCSFASPASKLILDKHVRVTQTRTTGWWLLQTGFLNSTSKVSPDQKRHYTSKFFKHSNKIALAANLGEILGMIKWRN